jgi:16S rRNA processing protein RimM
MGDADDLVTLGKVVGTHGIRGELQLVSYSGEYETLTSLRSVQFRWPTGMIRDLPVAGTRMHGGKVLLRLERHNDINDVSQYIGCEVLVPRSQLPELEEGEYYWHDLLGLRVITVSGEDLGRIREIFATGSNDVYEVWDGHREYLIPATEEVVTEIDLVARIMKVSPMEGLFDL